MAGIGVLALLIGSGIVFPGPLVQRVFAALTGAAFLFLCPSFLSARPRNRCGSSRQG